MIWDIVSRDVVPNPIDDDRGNHCLWIWMVADGAETLSELPKAGVGCVGYPRRY